MSFNAERKEMMQKFMDTVAASNNKILGEYKDASKQSLTDEDADLSKRFG